MTRIRNLIFMIFSFMLCFSLNAQNTKIRGFANVDAKFSDDSANANVLLGEQDLFITSQITDRISFLGESVFKFSPQSPTNFNVSIERLIIKYNYHSNHSILVGKHHTPYSLWNDKYHHGRVLFPSINRPNLFSSGILAVHTTGILLQGLNLGKNKLGYQFMIGNGIGSNDFEDDNAYKSFTLDLHASPKQGMRFGVTAYRDRFQNGSAGHHGTNHVHDSLDHLEISQLTGGAYFSYFRSKYEVLGEVHLNQNTTDSIGVTNNQSAYVYMGYRVKENWVPYLMYDRVQVDENEVFLNHSVKSRYTIGLRYEFSYLANFKLEYNRVDVSEGTSTNSINLQMAVGF